MSETPVWATKNGETVYYHTDEDCPRNGGPFVLTDRTEIKDHWEYCPDCHADSVWITRNKRHSLSTYHTDPCCPDISHRRIRAVDTGVVPDDIECCKRCKGDVERSVDQKGKYRKLLQNTNNDELEYRHVE